MNLLQFDLNLLKVLHVLLQTGSTKDTAQKLQISPSAVSHALSRLRNVLDDPLFRRENNTQVPTPYALGLKEKLIPLFSSLNEDLFQHTEVDNRVFHIIIPPALNLLLTPQLAQLSQLHNAKIECGNFERRSWRDEVIQGSVDLVLAIGDHQNPISALRYTRVGNTQLILLYGEPLKSQLASKQGLKLEELVMFNHIYCHPWPQNENELDRQLRRQGLNRNITFSCNDYSQIIPAIREAPLLAVVPRPWFESVADKSRVYSLELNDDKAVGGLFMMYRNSTSDWKKKIISSLKLFLSNYYH
nr:LysR family transcriptional regulator [uncultured Moellerella sp.]